MYHIDSLHLRRVEEIITEFGYPGKTMVGTPENESAWYVLQHNPEIMRDYMNVLDSLGNVNEIPKRMVALSKDRLLMMGEKEQIYGSQATARPLPVGADPSEYEYYIWPIKDYKNVNKRRKEMGFETTIEEYAQKLGFQYEVVTMQEALNRREMK